MNKLFIGVGILGLVGIFAVFAFQDTAMRYFFAPTESTVDEGELPEEIVAPEVVVDNLEIPWELVFLPGGEMLVTERPGRLLLIGEDRQPIPIEGVAHRGEGGLLGLALHPSFETNNWIYLYLTTATDNGLVNRVERYTLSGTELSERTIIIDNIPGAVYHDGGRIAFGPDELLYITTGDAGNESSAQNVDSLAGKILRVEDDGSIPTDNPFNSAVYSYGHRNPQGLAWDSAGALWITEHGRSGIQSGMDEINNILPGANYGWPTIEGDETMPGMRAPEMHSGADETWAPGGIVYLNEKLLFVGLRGQTLYAVDISSGEPRELNAYFRERFGRLRSITVGSDGAVYVLTSNRDGRGNPINIDDRIIRVDPRTFTRSQ